MLLPKVLFECCYYFSPIFPHLFLKLSNTSNIYKCTQINIKEHPSIDYHNFISHLNIFPILTLGILLNRFTVNSQLKKKKIQAIETSYSPYFPALPPTTNHCG